MHIQISCVDEYRFDTSGSSSTFDSIPSDSTTTADTLHSSIPSGGSSTAAPLHSGSISVPVEETATTQATATISHDDEVTFGDFFVVLCNLCSTNSPLDLAHSLRSQLNRPASWPAKSYTEPRSYRLKQLLILFRQISRAYKRQYKA